MPSELQRVAQQLLATLDEIPRVVAYLHECAGKYRESAGWIGSMSSNPSARMAATQLDEAARRCEEAAHFLSMAPPKARSWVEQMVSGVRTAEPAGGSTARRPDAPGGSPPPADRRQEEDQDEPEATKPGRAADAGEEVSPEEESPPIPGIDDDEARCIFKRLPERIPTPGYRPKTRGIWVDDHGNDNDLVSGNDDYQRQADELAARKGLSRPSPAKLAVTSHVEIKFAMMMRQRGMKNATIVINKQPCTGGTGCDDLLPHFLPDGGTLTVYAPDGFKRTYRGRSEGT